MADDPNRIDPRYDPAFQRGFTGEVRTARRGESVLRRAAVAAAAPDRAVSAAPAPAPERDESPTPPLDETNLTIPEPVGARPVPAPTTEAVPASEPASAADVTRNPFYLGAAALAVLLIVGGAVWLNQGFAAIAEDRASSNVGYYAAMAMSFGAPLLIGIGIAIIAGLLFVLARGWRPHGEDRD